MMKSGELSYSLPSFLYDTGFFLFCLRGEEGWFYETKKLKKRNSKRNVNSWVFLSDFDGVGGLSDYS